MRRIGSSVLVCLLFSLGAQADKKRQKSNEPYAVVAGTVFREPGYALPGADVSIKLDPQLGQATFEIKYPRAVSDSRGEFAFRVPVSAMRYLVQAKAKGYASQQKSVDVEGEQRVEVTLMLPLESK